MINVMRVISRIQACGVARALIYGNLTYGAEITPIQSDKTYKKMDRLIIRIIEDIYGWKSTKCNRTNNQKAFYEAGWMNYKNLHELCILRFLNRILMNGIPNQIFDKITKFFYWDENGKHFKKMKFCSGLAEAERLVKIEDGHTPVMVNKDGNKDMKLFPYNAIKIFNDLPKDIKDRIGTKSFATEVANYYKMKCQHRVGKPPSRCDNCKELALLNKPVDMEYTGEELCLDLVSFAGFRANCNSMKEIGNVIRNAKKTVITEIKQKEVWEQLVKVGDIETERRLEKEDTQYQKVKKLHEL